MNKEALDEMAKMMFWIAEKIWNIVSVFKRCDNCKRLTIICLLNKKLSRFELWNRLVLLKLTWKTNRLKQD